MVVLKMGLQQGMLKPIYAVSYNWILGPSFGCFIVFLVEIFNSEFS